MAVIRITITEPLANAVVGAPVQVKGSVTSQTSNEENVIVRVTGVKVRLGGGPVGAASRVGSSWGNWRFAGNPPSGSGGGSTGFLDTGLTYCSISDHPTFIENDGLDACDAAGFRGIEDGD